jgi:D-threo-aldose 1-dehydrogenase
MLVMVAQTHPLTRRTDQAALGLGGAALGNLFTAISDDAAHAVLTTAWADGCRVFDTAPHYGNGLSEQRFGRALSALTRDASAISSKVGRVLVADAAAPRSQNGYVDGPAFTQHWDYSAAGVRLSLEQSLERMNLTRLDTVYVHDCDAITHGAHYPAVLHQVIHHALPELRRMQREGLLQHIGLGVNDVQVCLDVLAQTDVDGLLLAGRYSLLDHDLALAQLLPLCQARGVRVTLGGVFNSGILVTGAKGLAGQPPPRFNYESASPQWLARVTALEQVCDEFAVPLRAAALQFAMAHPAVAVVLSGAQTVAQWQDTRNMAAFNIPPALWHALRVRGLIASNAPCPDDGGCREKKP